MAIDELLSRVYGPHPARVLSFDELQNGLQREVVARNVNVTREGDLAIYVYSTGCIFERNWNLFTLISRGLVLDVARREVVATPFPKFFNYGESTTVLPDEPFEVSQKVDGSLGVVFWHDGRWRVATKGALGSPQAVWAGDYLHRHADPTKLAPGTTYLCEIVYPKNRIVVSYDFEGLVLLGAYDARGVELDRRQLGEVASEVGLRLVGSRAFGSMAELVEVVDGLGPDAEGFVVRFVGGLRVKLKGREYCRVHRLMTQCTPLAIWEAMAAGDDLENMRRDLPEEFVRDFDAIRSLIDARLEALVAELERSHEATAHLSNKELGLLIGSADCELSSVARDFLFVWRRGDFRRQLAETPRVRQGVFRAIRPEGNWLEGYVPTTAVNRFRDDEG